MTPETRVQCHHGVYLLTIPAPVPGQVVDAAVWLNEHAPGDLIVKLRCEKCAACAKEHAAAMQILRNPNGGPKA